LVAEKTGGDLEVLREDVVAAHGPAFAGTQREKVRLHDDKSTYTGIHGSDGRHSIPVSDSTTTTGRRASRLSIDCEATNRSKSPASPSPSRERVKELFFQYDKNGDGTISIDELMPILQSVANMREADIRKMFRTMDKNGDGSIEIDEFVSWVFGRQSKQDARAKAALIPSDTSGLQLTFYKFCGPAATEMDGKSFTKLCKDCKLLGKQFTAADADVIFSKVIVPGQRRIGFEQFERTLELVAEKTGADLEELREDIAAAHGPAFVGTQKENVRLHDDKSTYTGIHGSDGRHSVSSKSGGPRLGVDTMLAAAQTKGSRPTTPSTSASPSRASTPSLVPSRASQGSSSSSLLLDLFKGFCGMAHDIDGKGFAKLCKDCDLLDKAFTSTDADILFAKVVTKGQRRIGYNQFLDALKLVAEKKGVEVVDIERTLVVSSGPVLMATQPEKVRLHDDRSTYTGSRSLVGHRAP